MKKGAHQTSQSELSSVEHVVRVIDGIFIAIIILLISLSAYLYIRIKLYERAFASLEVGITKQEVIDRMGTPLDSHQKCFEMCGSSKNAASELSYGIFPVPTVWAFTFDKNGKMIAKAELQSP